MDNAEKSAAAKELMINKVGEHPLQHIQFLAEIMKNT